MPSRAEIGSKPCSFVTSGPKRASGLIDSWYALQTILIHPTKTKQAVKAFVLVNHADKSQHDRGKTEVLDLCKRSPPVTEPEAIYQLQTALKTISLHDETSKLWERALTAKKDDKDLYTRWLNQAIADSDWRSAQKV